MSGEWFTKMQHTRLCARSSSSRIRRELCVARGANALCLPRDIHSITSGFAAVLFAIGCAIGRHPFQQPCPLFFNCRCLEHILVYTFWNPHLLDEAFEQHARVDFFAPLFQTLLCLRCKESRPPLGNSCLVGPPVPGHRICGKDWCCNMLFASVSEKKELPDA